MSMPSPSSRGPAKTELETVVHWPLLVGTAGLGLLLLAVPVVLACVAAMKGDPAKDKVAVRATPPAAGPANVAPVAAPSRPLVDFASPEAPAERPAAEEANPPRKIVKLVIVQTIDPEVVARPALDPVLQFPDVKTPPPMKRLDVSSEDALLKSLTKHAKEVDLESVKGTRNKLLAKAKESRSRSDKKSPSPILVLRAERADLKGLPMIGEADCQAKAETVKKMQAISETIPRFLGVRTLGSGSGNYYHAEELTSVLRNQDDWLKDDGISTVVQMVQVQEPLLRCALVKRLAAVKSVKASTVLARQALFDLAPEVREDAINALKDRPREDYRQVLLDGLRYPWLPVAAHAAEALVALDDRAAAFGLTALLDKPDPCAPVLDKDNNKWVVSEVVRINHLRNCLLCHAPSTDEEDPLRGIVPTPGKRLPTAYYHSKEGDFVRADITYLRQDFSVMERVAKPDKWPPWQRFDYMVRTRELTPAEQTARAKKPRQSEPASYPQRDMVLFALRELTGLDVGEDSADWYELLWAIQ
jgi:hypothetical protein